MIPPQLTSLNSALKSKSLLPLVNRLKLITKLLAGKFKDAEALEQAYIELQKKLGTNDENETEPAEEVRDEEDTTEEEVNPVMIC